MNRTRGVGVLAALVATTFGCGESPRPADAAPDADVATSTGGGGESAGAGSGGPGSTSAGGHGGAGTGSGAMGGGAGANGGAAGAGSAGSPAPDASVDLGGEAGTSGPGDVGADAGTFVMCDDHADFNGRGRCASTGKVGAVFALEDLSAGGAITTLTATFGTTEPPADTGCSQTAAGGPCTAFTCPRAATPGAPGPQAGAITAVSNNASLVTKPDATGLYDVAHVSRALWTLPKAALTFSAAGGATPAFGETFCGPSGVTITKPAGTPGAALTIDRASDLAVQWTGGAGGDLEFALRDDSGATATVEVRCFFPASDGQGTVPKAALAKIATGAHTIASYLWMRKIGGGGSGSCIELTGITTNNASTGTTPFNGAATFQ